MTGDGLEITWVQLRAIAAKRPPFVADFPGGERNDHRMEPPPTGSHPPHGLIWIARGVRQVLVQREAEPHLPGDAFRCRGHRAVVQVSASPHGGQDDPRAAVHESTELPLEALERGV